VRTEGSPGHLFPLDTHETVANERKGAAELEVPALGGLEYGVQFFCAMYTQRLGR
jgi:3,4-dihydroxy-2-butanone 4-phosphate synthase